MSSSRLTLDRRLKYALSGIGAGVLIVLAVLRAADLQSRHDQILLENEKRAVNLSAILSQYLQEVFAVTDTSLRQLAILSRRIGGPSASREEWNSILNSAKAGLTGVGSLSVVDNDGIIRHSTVDFIIGQSRRDNYVFQRLYSESNDILVASTPFRTLTKNPQLVIPLGRRLTTQEGKFDGAIVATLVPVELRRFFQTVDVGQSGIVWVFHPDGFILIREPSESNPMGQTAHGNLIFQLAQRANGDGTIRGPVAPGLPAMLSAFRATKEPQLFVAVSLNQNEVLAEWRRELYISVATFVISGLILLVITLALFRQIEARSLAEHALREETLRREIEGAEGRAAREVAEVRAAVAEELKRKNKELEAFSYSVSHDLRAPLRGIDGFSRLLLQDHAEGLDATGQLYLQRVHDAAQRMGELIDDLLQLSNVSHTNLRIERMDLSRMARDVIANLKMMHEKGDIEIIIQDGLQAEGDRKLFKIVLENLLGNAWKFSGNVANARIEFGSTDTFDGKAFFVRDNGAGFDMKYVETLFHPFRRLHPESEFPGTGIGLATVYRAIDRHGGRIWAESVVGHGATFFFTVAVKSAE